MAYINLTPHEVSLYSESQFLGLEQVNPTTWIADGVEGDALDAIPSEGCARISTSTQHIQGVLYRTTYGEATGIPSEPGKDLLIVSLPMQSMAKASGHPLASQMVSPYKVVRLRSNTSQVLGCMGFTY